MNGPNDTKFRIHIIIDKIYVQIVMRLFSQIWNRATALDWRQNVFNLAVFATFDNDSHSVQVPKTLQNVGIHA